MAKIGALVLLALVGVAIAKPFGGFGVAHKTSHVSHHSMVSPYLGFGMLGYPGIGIGHVVSSHSVSHAVPHYGLGLWGMKGLYGLHSGIGYGFMG